MIESAYSPKNLENKWYGQWVDARLFEKKIDREKSPYAVVIPPPNVTGILHMGHVLNNTIQDILVRRARQQNKSAVWMPGTDHAGISLQVKVEKELAKQGKTRKEIGREAFLNFACEWRDKNGGIILQQLKKLGVSCDWSSLKHTLDPDYSRAVLSTFVKLYQQGNIYKGKRLVNWCPVSQTALSDEEVIMKEQESFLYYVRYEIVEKPGEYLIVATTRPETIMGDAAIAVNPDDERYQDFVGLHCYRPIVRQAIPIIADAAVLKDFGTGALKVTPAHDVVDFEIGERHHLPMVGVIDKTGHLNELAGAEFCGMERFEAREKAGEYLEAHGALMKKEKYINNVGFSERSGVPIEPMLSEQWFLRYPRVKEAKRAVESGMIQFRPARWAKTYTYWLDHIKDWCISRQLWWGHRIPVWYKKNSDRHDPKNWHVSVDGPSDPENWDQDEDVLDTWFSSAIWPLAVFGWSGEKSTQCVEFKYFYPTCDLVTGPDIIFFWVARMIISGLNLLGDHDGPLTDDEIKRQIPFRNVYFTGIVRDHLGRKMSKSLGNSPDPLDLIDNYGADAVRFGMLLMAPSGQDILFSEERLAQGKKFCTKLWNAFRFRQKGDCSGDRRTLVAIVVQIDPKQLEVDDMAILGRFISLIESFENAMAHYEFSRATQLLYNFFWTQYCDWYIEVSKTRMDQPTVLAVHDIILRQLLLLLHPFVPFVTEELWHLHNYGDGFIGETILESAKALKNELSMIDFSDQLIKEVDAIQELVGAARGLKAQFGLSSAKDIPFYLQMTKEDQAITERHKEQIGYLLGTQNINFVNEPKQLPSDTVSLGSIYIDITEGVDIEAEKQRLTKEIEQINQRIEINEKKLHNEDFLAHAPENVIDGAKKLLEENQIKKEELTSILRKISMVNA